MKKTIIFIVLSIFSLSFIACKGEKSKTPHGYEYIQHIKKNGQKPKIGDVCYFNVDMKINDSIVSSSRERDEPARLYIPDPTKITENYPPIADVLALMSVGDSVTLFFPMDSLPRPLPGFEKAKYIVYDISMYNIKSEAEFKKEIEGEQKVRDAERAEIIKRKADVDQITKSKLSILKKPTAEVKKTKGGVSYIIIEEGKGNKPKKGDMINVFYHGMLENGKVFDSAFERGDPLSFPVGVGKVIRGWDETLLDFPVGTKAVILIPSEQAYGETGAGDRIPPNSNLVFYVDIKK